MQIRLPHLPRWAVRVIHWINLPLVEGYSAKRIDLLLVVLGIGIAGYYSYIGGLLYALTGLSVYGFIVMIALWF